MNRNTDSYLLLTSLRVCLEIVGQRVSGLTRGSTTKSYNSAYFVGTSNKHSPDLWIV